MKRLLSILIVVMLCECSASATLELIPNGFISVTPFETFFIMHGGTAIVDSWVYEYGGGTRIYSYQIENQSTTNISFFSVGILPDADPFDLHWDDSSGTVFPDSWSLVGTPIQSVEAMFSDTIGNGESSVKLWFRSRLPLLGEAEAVLFGRGPGGTAMATGMLPTPAPEPATILLLGIGGAFLTASRKRRIF